MMAKRHSLCGLENRLPVPPRMHGRVRLAPRLDDWRRIAREIAKWRIAELEAKIAEKKLDGG